MSQSTVDELYSIGDWIRWGASEFLRANVYFGHGTDNPWDEASALVLWVVKHPFDKLDAIVDARLSTTEREQIHDLIEARCRQRVPAAYLIGEAHFAGLRFIVNRDVLVPRSPIAELIDQQFQPWLSAEPHNILDLCTGSGCIGISCGVMFSHADVDLVDICTKALAVAQRNIDAHHLSARVRTLTSDVYSAIEPGRRYDLIVANPPYVDQHDLSEMPAEYHAEPTLGLAAGDDGLDIARKILDGAAHYLSDDGMLVLEVGNSWPALEQAYPNLTFVWPEFVSGGHGVAIIQAQQLRNCHLGVNAV